MGATEYPNTFSLPVSTFSHSLLFLFSREKKRSKIYYSFNIVSNAHFFLLLIFRPPKMCSSMMGGLSMDATLMESLSPEPFMNIGYF